MSRQGGTVTDNGDGTIDYTPAMDYNGQDTVIYTVCDPSAACVTDTLIVAVDPVNDAPAQGNETANHTPVSPVTNLDVIANNTDVEGDALTVTFNDVTAGGTGTQGGTFTNNGDGTVTYAPVNGSFMGMDTLFYQVCDTAPLCVNDTLVVNVTANNAPTAGNESLNLTEDDPLTKTSNVLANNTDPEGDPLTITSPPTASTQGNTVAYITADSTFEYTPAPDFCGLDTILYSVTDGNTTIQDTVLIDVACQNDAPVGDNEIAITTEDTPLPGIDLAANNSDVDGDALTVNPPAMSTQGGTVTDNGDGTIDYSPLSGYTGLDTIPYTVCDPSNSCVNDTVFVSISNSCITISTSVFLEGPFENGSMSTNLNDLGYLPGQEPATFFGTATAAGQPYSAAPWNYAGEEGKDMDYITTGNSSGNYAATAVDWVLVSLRTGTGSETEVCKQAGILNSNGQIEFVDNNGCCGLDVNETYYVVIEHRNHLLVMSHEKIGIVNNTIAYDFRTQQSYIGLLGFGQKEITSGVFTMHAGNGYQVTNTSADTDINVNDKDSWLNGNGQHSSYYFHDFDLNGDSNVQDKNLWLKNNGKFSDVPRGN